LALLIGFVCFCRQLKVLRRYFLVSLWRILKPKLWRSLKDSWMERIINLSSLQQLWFLQCTNSYQHLASKSSWRKISRSNQLNVRIFIQVSQDDIP
jgi:hypothetical protein